MKTVSELFDKKLGFGCMRLPMLEDGKVDFNTFRALVKRQIENGIHFLVLCGVGYR